VIYGTGLHIGLTNYSHVTGSIMFQSTATDGAPCTTIVCFAEQTIRFKSTQDQSLSLFLVTCCGSWATSQLTNYSHVTGSIMIQSTATDGAPCTTIVCFAEQTIRFKSKQDQSLSLFLVTRCGSWGKLYNGQFTVTRNGWDGISLSIFSETFRTLTATQLSSILSKMPVKVDRQTARCTKRVQVPLHGA
jgi:hypothetical protein